MLQVLVESRAARERSASWAGMSIVAHSALIGVALYLTARMAPAAAPNEPNETIVYSAPSPARATTPATVTGMAPIAVTRPTFSLPSIPLPSFDLPIGEVFSRVIADLNSASRTTGSPVGTSAPTGGIHTAATVDRIVAPLPGNTSPAYPPRLSSAGVEGEVLARFVVDTAGRVETKSIEIVQTSHALFGDAVTRWLRENRYSPALVDGRPVRQLVQQRIGFTLTR
jgi:protein TonB